jgi:hypothetical protein
MSKSQAIAAVTAVLSHRVGETLTKESLAAQVDGVRPKAGEGPDNSTRKVSIYLYQVTPNAAWRNTDLPTRDSDGNVKTRPQVALDLHYLFSFVGDEKQLEPQLMLGIVMRDLHAAPSLTREMIDSAGQNISDNTIKTMIANSELGKSIELVRFTPAALSLDELSKIWSIFFQTPYALSVAYQATVVLIEKDLPTQTALPVRERRVFAMPMARPNVERIVAKKEATNPDQIIRVGATALIQGTDLAAQETTVLVDGLEVKTENVRGNELVVKVPSELTDEDSKQIPLRAGSHTLQIVHGLPPAGLSSSESHRICESSPFPFVLRPTVQIQSVTDIVRNADLFSAKLHLVFTPNVAKAQRVWIVLQEVPASADQPTHSYRFMSPKDNGIAAPDGETSTIVFPVANVGAGKYLIEAHVDGGDSPPVALEDFA